MVRMNAGESLAAGCEAFRLQFRMKIIFKVKVDGDLWMHGPRHQGLQLLHESTFKVKVWKTKAFRRRVLL